MDRGIFMQDLKLQRDLKKTGFRQIKVAGGFQCSGSMHPPRHFLINPGHCLTLKKKSDRLYLGCGAGPDHARQRMVCDTKVVQPLAVFF
jgi:hypothetical protein